MTRLTPLALAALACLAAACETMPSARNGQPTAVAADGAGRVSGGEAMSGPAPTPHQ